MPKNSQTMFPIRFSVIIPTYNRAYCIEKAINSVLGDSHQDLELIVIDDGSIDNTREVIGRNLDPRLKTIYRKNNKGVNISRNEGIEKARGEWIIFLDSDDQFVPNWYLVLQNIIESVPEEKRGAVGIVTGGTKDASNNKLRFHLEADKILLGYEEILSGEKWGGEIVMVAKKKVFEDFKFPENMTAFEGFLWTSVARKYLFFMTKKILRIMNTRGTDRQTKTILMDPKNAKKRVHDYKKFLAEFGDDLQKINPKRFASFLMLLGFFYCLDGKMQNGRDYLWKSFRLSFHPTSFISLILSFLGQRPFFLILWIYKYFTI